ncbi:MAG: LytTR family transcriptional regulator [Erysipelotrichaceae bacterium]|nr:LytTR family transcriptional regulator [Erysipelotrichaceae bacterium]MBQ4571500.1 LytTR family transcriptional regulator DNA-binding domain-containing protein [Bacilli bacterium]
MKVKIIENPDLLEDLVTIECKKINQEILSISEYIENYGMSIVGKKDGEKVFINLKDIYYFEAVDNRVFAYTKDLVYEVNYRIQDINVLFGKLFFIQISRTIVINIDIIEKVSTLVNGRILAVLINGEKQIISRAYAHEFKNKLMMKGEHSYE